MRWTVKATKRQSSTHVNALNKRYNFHSFKRQPSISHDWQQRTCVNAYVNESLKVATSCCRLPKSPKLKCWFSLGWTNGILTWLKHQRLGKLVQIAVLGALGDKTHQLSSRRCYRSSAMLNCIFLTGQNCFDLPWKPCRRIKASMKLTAFSTESMEDTLKIILMYVFKLKPVEIRSFWPASAVPNTEHPVPSTQDGGRKLSGSARALQRHFVSLSAHLTFLVAQH